MDTPRAAPRRLRHADGFVGVASARDTIQAQVKEGDIAEQPENNIYFVTDAAEQQVKVCFETLTANDSATLEGDDWQGARFGDVWKEWAEHEVALKLTLCSGEVKPILGVLKPGTAAEIYGGAIILRDSWLETAPVYRHDTEGRRYRGIGRILVARLIVESKKQGAGGHVLVSPTKDSIPFYRRLGFEESRIKYHLRLNVQEAELLLKTCMSPSL